MREYYTGVERTIVFHSKEEWDVWRQKCCNDTHYHKYYVTPPTKFPCIGIGVVTPKGDLGEITTIDTFIYLTDFNV